MELYHSFFVILCENFLEIRFEMFQLDTPKRVEQTQPEIHPIIQTQITRDDINKRLKFLRAVIQRCASAHDSSNSRWSKNTKRGQRPPLELGLTEPSPPSIHTFNPPNNFSSFWVNHFKSTPQIFIPRAKLIHRI